MKSTWTAVRGSRVLTADGLRPGTMILADGRITAIEGPDAPVEGPVLDAGNALVFPGLVDTHVHVNDPGRTEWEGFETATAAAAAGGVTTIVDMPLNSLPPTTTVEGLEAKVVAARGRCRVDVALWGGCVPESCAEGGHGLRQLAAHGVRGFKAFLCDSGVAEFPPVTLDDLHRVAPVLLDLDLPLLVHSELPSELRRPDGDPGRYSTWLASRPQAAEVAAIRGLIQLAGEKGVRIHVVHLAADQALIELRRARSEGVPITVETCPHYLTFAAEEIADGDTRPKCAPPIRERSTREALWQALDDGDIDQVSTDHSPCTPDLKSNDFCSAWGGIGSLQLLLPLVWTGARKRGIDVARLGVWLASTPTRLAGLAGVGAIRPGAVANLVVWDPDSTFTVDGSRLNHRHPVCAYDGRELYGVVEHTLLRGHTVFQNGGMVGPAVGETLL